MKFRIVTNGEEFRIKRREFWRWTWEHTFDPHHGHLLVKFPSRSEAEEYLKENYGKNYELDKPWIISLK